MPKSNKRTCVVCGETYEYCNRCDKDMNKPSWYNNFHDENCMNIYKIIVGYHDVHTITKEKAKEELDKCDLSNKANFAQNFIDIINDIYDIKVDKAEAETQVIIERKDTTTVANQSKGNYTKIVKKSEAVKK